MRTCHGMSLLGWDAYDFRVLKVLKDFEDFGGLGDYERGSWLSWSM